MDGMKPVLDESHKLESEVMRRSSFEDGEEEECVPLANLSLQSDQRNPCFVRFCIVRLPFVRIYLHLPDRDTNKWLIEKHKAYRLLSENISDFHFPSLLVFFFG